MANRTRARRENQGSTNNTKPADRGPEALAQLDKLETTATQLENALRAMRTRVQSDTSLVAGLINLLPDELAHVEALVASLEDQGDIDCRDCGKNLSRPEVARHLTVCPGPYGVDAPTPSDLKHAGYAGAYKRLESALEDAGLDKGLLIELDTEAFDRMASAIELERKGVLAAVSRLVG